MDTICHKYIRPRNTKSHSVSISTPISKEQTSRPNRSFSSNTTSYISASTELDKKYFNSISKNNYDIDNYELMKYPAGNNFCNWLNIVCAEFNIVFSELESNKNYRRISIGNKSNSKIICVDWEYLNIHMIHVISNIISSQYNYNIDIIELPSNFAVKLVPSLDYEYDIEIKQLSDIYVRKENIPWTAPRSTNGRFVGQVFKEFVPDTVPHFYVI